MKKYYEEKDVSFSVNSSSEPGRENNTVTPAGHILSEDMFTQPVLTAATDVGGDTFGVTSEAGTGSAHHAFDDSESSYYLSSGESGHIIFYNPKPLVVRSIVYKAETTFYGVELTNDHKYDTTVTYGSDTGEFNGEEVELKRNRYETVGNPSTIEIDLSGNIGAFRYYKVKWETFTARYYFGANPQWWGYYTMCYDMKISGHEYDSSKEYGNMLDIKRHVVTSLDGKTVIIPEGAYDASELADGKGYLFSNIETKKTEALQGKYTASPEEPVFEGENIIWLDTSGFPLKLFFITEEGKTEKPALVKIGEVNKAAGVILDCRNDEFNKTKADIPVSVSSKYMCGYNGAGLGAHLSAVDEILYYKNTEAGPVEADKSDYDFYKVRPSFNVKDGGIMCFTEETGN